jgi:hypothetical protein
MNKFNYGQAILMKLLETPTTYAEALETKSRRIFGKNIFETRRLFDVGAPARACQRGKKKENLFI